MKKIILLTVFALSQLAIAQPVLNASDIPATYICSGQHLTGACSGCNGPSGANVVWDFSTVSGNFTPLESYEIIPINTAPGASAFPTANFCEKISSPNIQIYYFYALDNQSMQLLAINDYWGGFVTNFTNDPGTIFQFPYTYGTQFIDTIWALGSPTPPEPIERTYDGYGTFISQGTVYNNVIRQKMVNGFGQITYYWYQTNPLRLLMKGNLEDGNGADYYASIVLGTQHQTKDTFHLYPNPTTGLFTISGVTNETFSIQVYDALGKLILQQKDCVLNSTIDLKDCSSGIYFVKIEDPTGNLLATQKIVKN